MKELVYRLIPCGRNSYEISTSISHYYSCNRNNTSHLCREYDWTISNASYYVIYSRNRCIFGEEARSCHITKSQTAVSIWTSSWRFYYGRSMCSDRSDAFISTRLFNRHYRLVFIAPCYTQINKAVPCEMATAYVYEQPFYDHSKITKNHRLLKREFFNERWFLLYRFWLSFDKAPDVMKNVRRV